MQFHVEGPKRKGIVTVEKFKVRAIKDSNVQENDSNQWEMVALNVDIPLTGRRIVLLNNQNPQVKKGLFGFNRKIGFGTL